MHKTLETLGWHRQPDLGPDPCPGHLRPNPLPDARAHHACAHAAAHRYPNPIADPSPELIGADPVADPCPGHLQPHRGAHPGAHHGGPDIGADH